MEHRCGERVTLRVPVRIRRAGWDAAGMITNVSLSGGFVRTRLQAPILSLIEMRVFGASVSAYVVRVNSRGIALEWFEFAPAGIARLLTPLTSLELSTPIARLCATTRPTGVAASSVGFFRPVHSPLRRVRVGVGAKLDRHGASEEIEGFAENV